MPAMAGGQRLGVKGPSDGCVTAEEGKALDHSDSSSEGCSLLSP